ncbi:MAG: sulfatase-like hydrolase/transferase [bacterium]|nr:MAG: sulfatase-like hydrolase/transferase [bacterium]
MMAVTGGITMVNRSNKEKLSPNIVIIFIDDQGYADVGCFGAKGFETPNLDRMADEGMKFTNFHVSQAVCSASRASLLTGCYAERVGIQGALMPWSTVGLNPEEETIAEILKKRGYATGIFGKWHLGHHEEFLPLQRGFDEYLGLPYSNDMWPVGFDGKPVTEGRKVYYPPLPLIENNEKIDEIRTLEDQAKLTTLYTERAANFIEKNKDRPFFLYVPHTMVHVPLGVSEKFRGKSEQGMYGDVMMEIDWSVGEILKTLNKHGLDENTLVIYTSDNGPWLNFGNHAGSADPLREGKGTMWEGGCRVPCIMRWNGQIPAGSASDKMAATIDLLPTIAYITGASMPQKTIDGVNISSILKGDQAANPRDHFFYYYGGELRAVSHGKWKLYFPHKSRSYEGVEPGNDGFPGPYATLAVGLELYDLENDISETNNVIDEHPEVVSQLKALAEKAREELGDRLVQTKGKSVREPGRIGSQDRGRVKHLAVGKDVKLKNKYHPRYAGNGENTLVDGIRGSMDYNDGSWLGFEGMNLEATVDLGKIQSVKKIKCGFFQNQVTWIFLPTFIEIAVSTDGDDFQVIGTFNINTEFSAKPEIKDYSTGVAADEVRFVRIKARNVGTCPEWHPGAGRKAWIFVDEIVVK